MDWEKVVGANVRRLRKERRMTQERLALEAGVDLRYLGGVERGEHSPTVGLLGRLAVVLGVHPSALLNDADAVGG